VKEKKNCLCQAALSVGERKKRWAATGKEEGGGNQGGDVRSPYLTVERDRETILSATKECTDMVKSANLSAKGKKRNNRRRNDSV